MEELRLCLWIGQDISRISIAVGPFDGVAADTNSQWIGRGQDRMSAFTACTVACRARDNPDGAALVMLAGQ